MAESIPAENIAAGNTGTAPAVPAHIDAMARAAGDSFAELVRIMATLRAPGGCPWDAEQSHASLMRYLVEEAYEVVEAVEAPEGVNLPLLREELGDVLLQVVFNADIAASEPGGFDIVQVIDGLSAKLKDRHPDVYGSDEQRANAPKDASDQQARWDELKAAEKSERGPLDGIPPHLPALAMAEKTVTKAKKAGITLPPEPVSMTDDLPSMLREEDFGELLFTLVCRAKQNGLDSERALRTYTRHFIEHFGRPRAGSSRLDD